MKYFIIYYVVGLIGVFLYEVILNIIYKGRTKVMLNGFKVNFKLFKGIWKVIWILGAIVIFFGITMMIWPISMIWYLHRDITRKEEIKDTIELCNSIYKDLL